MSLLEKKMDDLDTSWWDSLICRDCKFRKPDSILPSGTIVPNANSCECQKYDDKPSACYDENCPYYEKESN